MQETIETPLQDVYGWLRKRSEVIGTRLRTRGLDLPDSSCLRNCVRTLGGGPLLLLDEDSGPEPEVDTQKMSASCVISTLSKDRMGDVVIPQGCLRLLSKNYGKNPRVFFSHRQTDFPVGSARHPDGTLAIQVLEDCIRSTCYFHGETGDSNLCFIMVKRKELQAASIGFLPVKAAVMARGKAQEGDEDTNEFGEDLIDFSRGSNLFPSLRFHEWDLTEWSWVPIPANSECISMHLSRGEIEGEKLTETFRKSLEPWAAPRKVWSPGALLSPETTEIPPVLEEKQVETPAPVVVPEPEVEKTLDGPIVESKFGEDLIPAPSPEKPREVEDPTKGWPHGAKCMCRALASMDSHCCLIDEHQQEMDNPKLKKYLDRHKSKMLKVRHKMASVACQLYPDKFEDPGPAPAGQEKSLDQLFEEAVFPPAVKEVPPAPAPPEIDWDQIFGKLDTMASSQARLNETFFEITGRRI